jgi:hypothetical protein
MTSRAVGQGFGRRPHRRPPILRALRFSAVAGGADDPSVVTGMPAWREAQLLVARELGEPVSGVSLIGFGAGRTIA